MGRATQQKRKSQMSRFSLVLPVPRGSENPSAPSGPSGSKAWRLQRLRLSRREHQPCQWLSGESLENCERVPAARLHTLGNC